MRRETVVEMPEFIRRAKALLTESDKAELIDYLSANPEAGVLLAVVCENCGLRGPVAARAAVIG